MQRQRTEAQNGVFLQQALSVVIDKKRVQVGWHLTRRLVAESDAACPPPQHHTRNWRPANLDRSIAQLRRRTLSLTVSSVFSIILLVANARFCLVYCRVCLNRCLFLRQTSALIPRNPRTEAICTASG
jgi:hypothetical protein